MTPHDIQTRPIKFGAIELAKILGLFNNLHCYSHHTSKSKLDPRTVYCAAGRILADPGKRTFDADADDAIGATKV